MSKRLSETQAADRAALARMMPGWHINKTRLAGLKSQQDQKIGKSRNTFYDRVRTPSGGKGALRVGQFRHGGGVINDPAVTLAYRLRSQIDNALRPDRWRSPGVCKHIDPKTVRIDPETGQTDPRTGVVAWVEDPYSRKPIR